MDIIKQIKVQIDKWCEEYGQKVKTRDLAKMTYYGGVIDGLNLLYSFLDTLKEPEVDLEKLGGIARHLIAVKNHEEDMRLDEGEWLLLERIGYPERFNARKEE